MQDMTDEEKKRKRIEEIAEQCIKDNKMIFKALSKI